MSTALDLKCYLYQPRYPAIERSDQANDISSDAAGTILTLRVPLMPVGGENRITIKARLIRPTASPLACKAGALLWWQDEESGDQVRGCNIHVKTPASPDWNGTLTSGEFAGPLHLAQPNLHAEDAGPDISAPEHALWYKTWELSNEVASLRPGETISMQADYLLNPAVGAEAYYSTLALTSGVITDKLEHPSVPRAYVYYVTLEGEQRGELYPTDFLEYQIGERVAILRETTDSATLYRQPGLLRPPLIKDLPNINLRPAPVRFL